MSDRGLHCLQFLFDLLDLIIYGVRVFGHLTVFNETLIIIIIIIIHWVVKHNCVWLKVKQFTIAATEIEVN